MFFMNLKDTFLPIILAVSTMWLMQYFFSPRTQPTPQAGAEFAAPISAIAIKPLALDVKFAELPASSNVERATIETKHATLTFSNAGAVLENFVYKKNKGNGELLRINTIAAHEKEKGMLLVALDGTQDSPYLYTLLDRQDKEGVTTLRYKAQNDVATIIKQFDVHQDSFTIDLTLTVEPHKQIIQPRVIYGSPEALPVDGVQQPINDNQLAFIYGDKGLVTKKPAEVAGKGWERPHLFGIEDKYFANALISDKNQFTQRAYYKSVGKDLQAILEGPEVKDATSWKLSFYFGPRESQPLAAADSRLEGLLDYGWFAPISKVMLYLLNFINGYIHNYGWAIIILTLLLKLLLFPLTSKAEQSAKLNAEIQRKMAYLDQKYKHDPETLAREKTELMKKHGLSMLGCLPLLLQIPVFIGLQRVLSSSLELYKAPFLWIKDLSQADPYFILPILVGIGMAVQMMQTGDARQRMTNGIIALVITAATSYLSAGLTLFIAVNSLSSVLFSKLPKSLKLW